MRSLLSEFKDYLYLVYTPAYDPDANRIEWHWRVSRRVVTQNHHRSTFALLLADTERHFQALGQMPASVLRHIWESVCSRQGSGGSSVTRPSRLSSLEVESAIAQSSEKNSNEPPAQKNVNRTLLSGSRGEIFTEFLNGQNSTPNWVATSRDA